MWRISRPKPAKQKNPLTFSIFSISIYHLKPFSRSYASFYRGKAFCAASGLILGDFSAD